MALFIQQRCLPCALALVIPAAMAMPQLHESC